MAPKAVAKAAFAAFSAVLTRRAVRFGFRSVIGMGAAGGAMDYRSVVVDMTVPGEAVQFSDATLTIMDEIPEVPEGFNIVDMIGELPSKGVYPKRDPEIITTHYWHHSASDTLASFESLARTHIARGWPGIGYTGAIRQGRFYIFHPLDRVTNHTQGRNSKGVATVLVGNFDLYPMHPPMERAVEAVRRYYQAKGIVKEQLHREVKATACPGRYAVPVLKRGRV